MLPSELQSRRMRYPSSKVTYSRLLTKIYTRQEMEKDFLTCTLYFSDVLHKMTSWWTLQARLK